MLIVGVERHFVVDASGRTTAPQRATSATRRAVFCQESNNCDKSPQDGRAVFRKKVIISTRGPKSIVATQDTPTRTLKHRRRHMSFQQMISPSTCALAPIDFQPAMFQGVQSHDRKTIADNVQTLPPTPNLFESPPTITPLPPHT